LTDVKTFWFGCQSNSKVGLGHVSRCVSLAEEIESRGHFSCFAHVSNLDSRGRQLLALSSLKSECNCNSRPDVVIYDSYDLDFIEKVQIPTEAKVVLLVDDVSLPFIADGYIEASPIKTWIPLNGTAPIFKFDTNPILRRQFDASAVSINFSCPFDLILTFGAVKELGLIIDLLFPVISGNSLFSRKVTLLTSDELNYVELAKSYNLDLQVLRGTYNLRDLIDNKTFVISAAGVTAWELITLGVPGFLIAVAENQYEQLDYFNRLGLREGVVYQGTPQIATDIHQLVESGDFIDHANQAKSTIRNGRVNSIDWLLEKVLSYPNHQG
jgi:UDP-2,4-diacetamido-2,4,6-trideoxy-beta-L-altropyranose hydrolase